MNQLILCDDCNPQKIKELCNKFEFGIEIQSFYDPEHHIDYPDTFEKHKEQIKNITTQYFHGPFGDLCPGSFDSMVRDVALNRYELAVTNANNLGIKNIIFHAGYVPFAGPPKSWIKRSSELWKKFLDNKPSDIKFHIENLFEKTPKFLYDLIEAIDDTRVTACLDIGHAHCHSDEDVISWIEHLGDKISYVHMHNNNGKLDEHLGLDSGTIPILEVCKALNKFSPNADWALEVNLESMKSSIELLKKNDFIDF